MLTLRTQYRSIKQAFGTNPIQEYPLNIEIEKNKTEIERQAKGQGSTF